MQLRSRPSDVVPRLAGKRALVTGGSSGIGQAIAVRLAREGAGVAVGYRSDAEGARETKAMIREARRGRAGTNGQGGALVSLVQADVAKKDEARRMVRAAAHALGGLDLLVCNAGIQIAGDSHEIGIEAFDRVIAVNLRGTFLCAQAALRHFLGEEKPGAIVNVSSVHQTIPKPRFAGYAASKGGVHNLTRTLALEYAGRGIRVNAIGPGATITPINSAWADDPEKKAEVERHIPMGRAGEAEEMAAATAFLCSDEAAYITGQTLYVDGGLTLYPDFRTAWSSE